MKIYNTLRIVVLIFICSVAHRGYSQRIDLKELQAMAQKPLANLQSDMTAKDFNIVNVSNDKTTGIDSIVYKHGANTYMSFKMKKRSTDATVSYSFSFKDLYLKYANSLKESPYVLLHSEAIPALGIESIYYDKDTKQLIALLTKYDATDSREFYPSTYSLKVFSQYEANKVLRRYRLKTPL